jgi:ABC-type transporter Mla subunit MlaD
MASPLDIVTGPLRSLLGTVERDVVTPLRETTELDDQLVDAVQAIHRAAESMERHVEVVETLANSVPGLTDSVNALVAELNSLLKVIAPVAAVEADLGKLGHLFGRHQHEQAATADHAEAPTPAEADPPSS